LREHYLNKKYLLKQLAYIGCFENWKYWDLFTYGLTQSLIESSEWTQNIWQHYGGISNWYAWTNLMTVSQCVNYCYTKGFLLAGLTHGLNIFLKKPKYKLSNKKL
jgi:hypothetical protein